MAGNVGDLLQKLIREERQGEKTLSGTFSAPGHLTTLGAPLIPVAEGRYRIDITGIRVLRNLSTFIHLLTGEVLEQCGFGVTDIMVKRKVDAHLTPELSEAGVDWVMVYARLDAAEHLPRYHNSFNRDMQLIFSMLQTVRWGGLLFPDFFNLDAGAKDAPLPALLFPFHLDIADREESHYMLLEFNRPGRFLRVTIEDAPSSRLQLKHISHRVVDNIHRAAYLPDMHHIAGQIHQGILRECFNNRTEYKETPDRQSALFDHLRQGGLDRLGSLYFRWTIEDIQPLILRENEGPSLNEAQALLHKELMLLQDPDVRFQLHEGHIIEMQADQYRVFFSLSRRHTCLNISLSEEPHFTTLNDYFEKMPLLKEAAVQREGSLHGVRLFLIHHITAEVLGLIRAFQKAGCEFITTLFVKYAGVVPDEYFETILSLPDDSFRFCGIHRIETPRTMESRYVISQQYSDISDLQFLDTILWEERRDFKDAMRLVAGHLFFEEAIRCRKAGITLLLVEDGGYLSPLINRFCLEQKTLGDVLRAFHVDAAAEGNPDLALPEEDCEAPVAEWLAEIFAGTVEHTKNGHDENAEVMHEYGTLRFPLASIAVSRLKRGPEAKECAIAILNAVENILHRQGLLLSRRRALVIGSSGAIGRRLIDELSHRLIEAPPAGVDIAASDIATTHLEVRTLEELDRSILYGIDMIIGAAGRSVMTATTLADMLIEGAQEFLYFVSGSTKTVEFTEVETWLHSLMAQKNPRIAGHHIEIAHAPLRDLQTSALLGHEVRIAFSDGAIPPKRLYLLGELTPINFLYYGIPREILDDVMRHLFRVSVGLIERKKAGEPLPRRLLAVDHDIDMDARRIDAPFS